MVPEITEFISCINNDLVIFVNLCAHLHSRLVGYISRNGTERKRKRKRNASDSGKEGNVMLPSLHVLMVANLIILIVFIHS